MAKQQAPKSRFKFWLNIFTLVALGAVIFFGRSDIAEALRRFAEARFLVLLLIIPMQILNYYSVAQFYKSVIKGEQEIPFKEFYKLGLEMNFVNIVLPSGGVSGFSYLTHRMKRYGVTTANGTLAQVVRFAMTFLSFIVLLFVGLFLLSAAGTASQIVIFFGTIIAFLTLGYTLTLVYIISNEHRISSVVIFLPKLVNRLARTFRLTNRSIINVEKVDRLFRNLHADYMILTQSPRRLIRPFWWALAINSTEIASIYLAYMAFGHWVNPGAIIMGYAAANFAGVLSIWPGGFGVYEALMTTVVTSSGIPSQLAVSATLVYRFFPLLCFLPVGSIFYRRVLSSKDESMRGFTRHPTTPTPSEPRL